MPEKIILEVVTPERLVLREEVDEVLAPGSEGDFGVLPGHCEFLTLLRGGEVHYRIGEQGRSLEVQCGFAQVMANRIIILADSANLRETNRE
ncbi:MAG: ATP synthase F1 subunit epsilon [Nitrospiria bacterium]